MAYKEFIVYSKTKAEFEALVSSNEVDNTQMGIIAETGEMWWEGEYRPIAETAPFAKDLTGVLEATPEEFTFRTSAGTKFIRDESAVIRRIKGNTSVWGQKLQSIPTRENFEDVTTFYDSSTNECVIQNISRTTPYTSGSSRYEIKPNLYPIVGHKYVIFSDRYYKGVGVAQLGGVFWEVNTIFEATNSSLVYFRLNRTFDFINTCPIGSEVRLRINIVDLTELRGKGNEPTTIEEFKRLYPDSYYPYCVPEVRSMRATGIETIGDNAFNGSYAEVLGGEQYYLNGVYMSIGFSKTIEGESTAITIPNNRIYTPSERGYIRATGTDISIQLVHSGIRNGEFHDYWESERKLPDIAKYFPDGMHGIGDVYDEINEEIAIKRFGVRAYEEGDYANVNVMTDGTNTVYVLPLPVVTPVTEPLQWYYKVADFGTEKMLSDLPSSPFRADIVYQFNAEGRIRDNARNIERLEEHTKNMATMEDVIEKIPTAIATATERVTTWPSDDRLVANVLVDVSMETSKDALSILGFVGGSSDYSFDDVWRIRFAGLSSQLNVIPQNIYWVNGQAPSFDTWAICDIEFRRTPSGNILGEWKIYR